MHAKPLPQNKAHSPALGSISDDLKREADLALALAMSPPRDPALAATHGMPALDASAHKTSWFEFAPAWAFYFVPFLYVLWQGLKHRKLTLLTGSNPALPMSGLVGESKYQVLSAMRGPLRRFIAPYRLVRRQPGPMGSMRTLKSIRMTMKKAGFSYPIVAKPDTGMRGAGVQLVKTPAHMKAYVDRFPAGADIMLQQVIEARGEAGVFYMRKPGEKRGQILSLTLKYFPKLTGDGTRTVAELLDADPRASQLRHIYLPRITGRMDEILPAGETIDLVFAGNHSKGTIFRDGADHITDAMTARFDQLADAMGEFYVGRFDIRFADLAQLKQGRGFRIIEVNGAGGETTHIWDSRITLRKAYAAICTHYRSLYDIGATNRRRGFEPSTMREFIQFWWRERQLTKEYPDTD